MSQMAEIDAKVLEKVRDGGRTFHIAKSVGCSTNRARAALRRLEAAGKVARDERFTYVNDIYWRPSLP